MSATRCTCLRDGLTLRVVDPFCLANHFPIKILMKEN